MKENEGVGGTIPFFVILKVFLQFLLNHCGWNSICDKMKKRYIFKREYVSLEEGKKLHKGG